MNVTVIAILCFVFAAGFAFVATRPRTSVWHSAAWRYRHPELHEPSDAAYRINVGVTIVAAVLLVAVGLLLLFL